MTSLHPSELPVFSLLSDEEIVERVCAGERHLFELLMRRHNRKVFRAARAILKRDDEAEDVMQDAYVRAFTHLAEFKGEARFSTWLTRIAIYEAYARVRRERRLESLDAPSQEASMVAERQSPEQAAMDFEMRRLLDRAIDELPEEFRLVFVLREVEQMSVAETSEILGVQEQTVKTRLFRARKKLQESLVSSIERGTETAYGFHLTRCDRVVNAVLERIGVWRVERRG
ncbi:MAG: RNA polymerase sigma factor [Myxococcales bacterium]